MFLDTTVALNSPWAPWGGCKVFRTLQNAANQYFDHFTHKDWLFQVFYPTICEYLGAAGDHSFGDDEHQKYIFNLCTRMSFIRKLGSKVKLKRWQSWFKRVEEVSAN